MSNVEEFRKQLEEGDSFRRQIKQDEIMAEKSRRQKERTEFWEGIKRATPRQVVEGIAKGIKESVEETKWWKDKKKNEEVFQLASQFPIKQYLEVLRDKVAPMRQVRSYGPKNGKIAYALTYKARVQLEATGKSHTKIERVERWVSGRGFSTIMKFNEEREIANVGPRMVRDVLGVVFDDSGLLQLTQQQCAKAPAFEKSINPLTWGRHGGRKEIRKFNTISITSPEGLQQFAQALVDFYVGLKAGQGK
ncbi:MAG: hypothetical protein V1810_00925 [Candidatus Beckwithbacteria bacterium]